MPHQWALRATLVTLGPASLALAPTFGWASKSPAVVGALLLAPALLIASAIVHRPHRLSGRLLATAGDLWWAANLLVDRLPQRLLGRRQAQQRPLSVDHPPHGRLQLGRLTHLQPATWATMLLVMFIGGSPGSTAGGVKTTTAAVLVMAVASAVRGRTNVAAFGRRVPTDLILRAAAILTLGIVTGFTMLLALLLTQPALPVDEAIYEVVNAASTVGLSMGATAMLDDVGKVIIIFAMFLGRIGPISLFIFFSTNPRARTQGALVEETVPIG